MPGAQDLLPQMLRKDALRDGPKRQSLLDKAIGPAGLPSLRSAVALSAATYKKNYYHWQVRIVDDGAKDSLYAKHEKVGFMSGGDTIRLA